MHFLMTLPTTYLITNRAVYLIYNLENYSAKYFNGNLFDWFTETTNCFQVKFIEKNLSKCCHQTINIALKITTIIIMALP